MVLKEDFKEIRTSIINNRRKDSKILPNQMQFSKSMNKSEGKIKIKIKYFYLNIIK